MKRCIIILTLMTLIVSCHQKKDNKMRINWIELSTEGLVGNLQKGVSASYSALLGENLIVAGGANFPDKLGFEGGSKANYDEILRYNFEDNKWQKIGELPQKSAYGVSVPLDKDFLWLGGIADKSLSIAYKISLDKNSVQIDNFPELPATMDNFTGCSLGNDIFIGGGFENGKPSNSFYTINSKTDKTWQKLPNFPGIARVQPVMVAMEQNNKKYVYILGGFFGGDDFTPPQMATDILRYSVSDKKWEKVGKQIDSKTQKPFSLGGATAMPLDNRYIVCFGGVNYDIFLQTIKDLYQMDRENSLSDEEKNQKKSQFLKEYLTQPIEYYKFNSECRVFDTETGVWQTIDITPKIARAGATIVYCENTFYLVQGELKPGVRSPKTWKGEIKNP